MEEHMEIRKHVAPVYSSYQILSNYNASNERIMGIKSYFASTSLGVFAEKVHCRRYLSWNHIHLVKLSFVLQNGVFNVRGNIGTSILKLKQMLWLAVPLLLYRNVLEVSLSYLCIPNIYLKISSKFGVVVICI